MIDDLITELEGVLAQLAERLRAISALSRLANESEVKARLDAYSEDLDHYRLIGSAVAEQLTLLKEKGYPGIAALRLSEEDCVAINADLRLILGVFGESVLCPIGVDSVTSVVGPEERQL